jgi:hypothetical protein
MKNVIIIHFVTKNLNYLWIVGTVYGMQALLYRVPFDLANAFSIWPILRCDDILDERYLKCDVLTGPDKSAIYHPLRRQTVQSLLHEEANSIRMEYQQKRRQLCGTVRTLASILWKNQDGFRLFPYHNWRKGVICLLICSRVRGKVNNTSDYTLWTSYRSYFKNISAIIEPQVYSVLLTLHSTTHRAI